MKTNKNSPRIVLIDDDSHQAKFIISGLKLLDTNFQIEYIEFVDEVHKNLTNGKWNDVALFLVDVMMPPGKRYAKELTRDGEITGFFVVREIRDTIPYTPILLWSTDPLNRIEIEARKFVQDSVTNCAFYRKENAIKTILLCYQNIIDAKPLSHLPAKTDDKFDRLRRWVGTLGPIIVEGFKEWVKFRSKAQAT